MRELQTHMDDVDVQKYVPAPSVLLAGFPTCRLSGCGTEVAKSRDLCAYHGGAIPSEDIQRRTLERMIRTAVALVLACQDCKDIGPCDTLDRCEECAFHAGMAYVLGTVMEKFGCKDRTMPYMGLIFLPR
jgi:hypothetical protein